MRGKRRRWVCPRKCGYFREWHDHADYLELLIYHPLYGPILEKELVELDVRTHSCRLYRLAHRSSEPSTLAVETVPAMPARNSDPIHSTYVSRGGMAGVRTERGLAERSDSALSNLLPGSPLSGREDNGIHD